MFYYYMFSFADYAVTFIDMRYFIRKLSLSTFQDRCKNYSKSKFSSKVI